MNCIIFREGVYTAIEEKDCSDEQGLIDSNLVIIEYNDYKLLYGGRVNVFREEMNIDGIPVKAIGFRDGYMYVSNYLSLSKITSYLNQIENLGVDTFLTNYKKSVEMAKRDCAKLIEGYEQDLALTPNDTEIKGALAKLRKIMQMLVVIFFSLSCYMNVGLDNHVYIDNYDAIVNLYFS